jgi:acyl-CoA thioester hydrolase
VDYHRELLANDALRVTTRLLDCSEKLIHLHACVYHAADNALAATQEILFLHVSLTTRRSMPMPPESYARLQAVLAAHRELPLPEGLGRKLAIRR